MRLLASKLTYLPAAGAAPLRDVLSSCATYLVHVGNMTVLMSSAGHDPMIAAAIGRAVTTSCISMRTYLQLLQLFFGGLCVHLCYHTDALKSRGDTLFALQAPQIKLA